MFDAKEESPSMRTWEASHGAVDVGSSRTLLQFLHVSTSLVKHLASLSCVLWIDLHDVLTAEESLCWAGDKPYLVTLPCALKFGHGRAASTRHGMSLPGLCLLAGAAYCTSTVFTCCTATVFTCWCCLLHCMCCTSCMLCTSPASCMLSTSPAQHSK